MEGEVPKKSRKRPKVKGIRVKLCRKLEEAIFSTCSVSNLLKDEDGIRKALWSDILKALDFDDKEMVHKLTAQQIQDLSKISKVFDIAGPTADTLVLSLKSAGNDCVEDRTAYVDNLPPSCTEAQLRRRASVFGTVTSVVLPQIRRLQRRICPGVEFPLNSGFGFVQFTSKSAVRRFCKSYISNSHFNRSHHPKTHRKRKGQDKAKVEDEHVQKLIAEGQRVTRKRRLTELSVSEMSGLDDSGAESDAVLKFSNSHPAIKDHPRTKRRRHRKSQVPKMSLAILFSKMQVLPYHKYADLRREYLELKKENERQLQNIIKHSPGTSAKAENSPTHEQADTHPKTKTVHRRTGMRSRATVVRMAARIKDASLEQTSEVVEP